MKFRFKNGTCLQVVDVENGILPTSTENMPNAYIIDINDLKNTAKYIKNEWLGGEMAVHVSTGIFWVAFMSYIFPLLLDIAKVFVAFKVAMAFYDENKSGGGGHSSKSGFGAIKYYAIWYLAFWLIPWGVELIDQIGGKMHTDLLEKGIDGLKR